uniref:Uncharacterized protein n=1 Tax=Cyclophora tenuis TaxID=216820 RepID=A0A7S1GI64_CYCTE|eukprot:CAMPEP_0116559610 /NCGR_PEP_ID=MMETSP0397-20121206/10498_1 /TAXON_ID=216820 /ORGANISM="Cyclophora tenuis, Strain ECT3854" /LENGTH=307 /DNA_ID=CAMNT_0004085411 /DNA_START=74 /DNA_END=997 /DNA_ORIENTATION=+
MRSFTGRGGCALFLETILKIHGKTTVEKMMKRSRAKGPPVPLLNCTCEQRQEKRPTNGPRPTNKNILDTTPPGHSCMSIELLSLLLTGKVHSSLKGWSSSLGVGILSSANGEVGSFLKRPEKPVWILRGETCSSLLWLTNEKDTAFLDQAGRTLDFSHWNFWYGQTNKSTFRMTTRRSKWAPPPVLKQQVLPKRRTVMESIVERRKKRTQNVVSGDENEVACVNKEVTKEELERVKEHPEDRHFYPNQYCRWRYDLCGNGQWQPFHQLTKHEQLVVETKLAPRINHIIRTRWPDARLEHPSNHHPVV